jgi:hypothetical protein
LEDGGGFGVDIVVNAENDFCDAHLADFDTARQARATWTLLAKIVVTQESSQPISNIRVAVERCSVPDPVTPSFQQGILLGVETEARIETDTRMLSSVAPRTYFQE